MVTPASTITLRTKDVTVTQLKKLYQIYVVDFQPRIELGLMSKTLSLDELTKEAMEIDSYFSAHEDSEFSMAALLSCYNYQSLARKPEHLGIDHRIQDSPLESSQIQKLSSYKNPS